MGFQPVINRYRPPFITQTDEAVWNDCTICATLMATASATLGRTVMGHDWRPLTAKELKRRRELIRNEVPGDKDIGGTSMADMRVAFGSFYPWLPDLKEVFYDVQRNSWADVIRKLKADGCGVLQGNPQDVVNPQSKLRRWTNNDNFGHAIFAERARESNGETQIFIMDPLGRGEYDGEWVPADEVRQFIWTESNYVKANMFVRGGWSPEKLAAQDAAEEYIDRIKQLNGRIRDLRGDSTTLQAKVVALTEQIKNAPPSDEALKVQLAELNTQLAQVQAQYEATQAQYDAIVEKQNAVEAAADNLMDVLQS
jgi:hypothetical protein